MRCTKKLKISNSTDLNQRGVGMSVCVCVRVCMFFRQTKYDRISETCIKFRCMFLSEAPMRASIKRDVSIGQVHIIVGQ